MLVLVSLALITLHFRESDDGPLHAAQRIGVSVLMPFEVAGERVSRPFRDGWAYLSDLLDAKSDNEELRKENEELRRLAIANQTAAQEIARLEEFATYVSGPKYPTDFNPIVATVVRRPSNPFNQEIMIAAGRDDGVVKNAPVVTEDGLVGLVTDVTGDGAKVTLITDQNSAVTAVILEGGAWGIVRPGRARRRSSSTASARTSWWRQATRRHRGVDDAEARVALPARDRHRDGGVGRPAGRRSLQARPGDAVRRLRLARPR